MLSIRSSLTTALGKLKERSPKVTVKETLPRKCTLSGAFNSGRTEIQAIYHGTTTTHDGIECHAFTYLTPHKNNTGYSVERACVPVNNVGTLEGSFTVPLPEKGISRSYPPGTREHAEGIRLMQQFYPELRK